MSDKINIKTIQERLGVPITGNFVETELKIEPTEREKRAVYWLNSQYAEICDKLIEHIKARRGATAVAAKPAPKAKETKTQDAPADDFSFGDDTPAEADGFAFGDDTPAADDGFAFTDEPAVEEDTFSFE